VKEEKTDFFQRVLPREVFRLRVRLAQGRAKDKISAEHLAWVRVLQGFVETAAALGSEEPLPRSAQEILLSPHLLFLPTSIQLRDFAPPFEWGNRLFKELSIREREALVESAQVGNIFIPSQPSGEYRIVFVYWDDVQQKKVAASQSRTLFSARNEPFIALGYALQMASAIQSAYESNPTLPESVESVGLPLLKPNPSALSQPLVQEVAADFFHLLHCNIREEPRLQIYREALLWAQREITSLSL